MCTVGDCVKKGLRLDTGATTNLYSKQLGLEKHNAAVALNHFRINNNTENNKKISLHIFMQISQ